MIYSLLLFPLKAFLQRQHKIAVQNFGKDDPDFIFELPCTNEALSAGDGPQPVSAEPAEEPAADAENGDVSSQPEEQQLSEDTGDNLLKAVGAIVFMVLLICGAMWTVVEPACQAFLTPHVIKLFRWMQ